MLEPVAKFTHTEAIIQRVYKIAANENKLILENGDTVDYDILCINVGS